MLPNLRFELDSFNRIEINQASVLPITTIPQNILRQKQITFLYTFADLRSKIVTILKIYYGIPRQLENESWSKCPIYLCYFVL